MAGKERGKGGKGKTTEKRKRFDEPFEARRNPVIEDNPEFWRDYCHRQANIDARWQREYGSQFRRERSLSPVVNDEENAELLHVSDRYRSTHFVRPGSCIYCHLLPCRCYSVTYGGSVPELNVTDASWERVPYGCLQMMQSRGMVSDPGGRMIYYVADPTLAEREQREAESGIHPGSEGPYPNQPNCSSWEYSNYMPSANQDLFQETPYVVHYDVASTSSTHAYGVLPSSSAAHGSRSPGRDADHSPSP